MLRELVDKTIAGLNASTKASQSEDPQWASELSVVDRQSACGRAKE